MKKLLNNIDIQTDVNYCRVIPRDLFNEAKLLKCIGRLALNIHDGNGLGITVSGYPISFGLGLKNNDSFQIGLMSDGYLVVANLGFKLGNEYLLFRTLYNSKNNYPLVCTRDFCDVPVFDESGEYTEEFKFLISELSI